MASAVFGRASSKKSFGEMNHMDDGMVELASIAWHYLDRW